MLRKSTLAPALLTVLVVAVVVQLVISATDRAEDYRHLDALVEVQDLLMDRYVQPVDREALARSALDAMVASLDDPYTTFIPPEQMEAFEQQLTGVYAGIGAEIATRDGWLVIVTPFEGSPALEAGLFAGTIITEIEGQSTEGLTPAECADLLLGPPGTSVSIRHLPRDVDPADVAVRLDEAEPATLVRRRITTSVVAGLRRLGTDWDHTILVPHDQDGDAQRLAYVHLRQFSPTSPRELRSLIERLHDDGHAGLILDLRDNPGGSLPAAIDISDFFLEEGVITSVRERNGVETIFHTDEQAILPDLPLLVLVNGNAASASEILAGALQDNDRAPVMGSRTYGKGLVQEVAPLPLEHGTLKLTVAHYYLPSGRNINRMPDSTVWGVDPSPGLAFLVPDEAYIDWLEARQELEAIESLDAPGDALSIDTEWLRDTRRDPMLAEAAELLAQRIRTNAWTFLASLEEDADLPTSEVFREEMHRAALRRAELMEQLADVDEEIERLHGLADAIHLPDPLPDSELRGGTITVRDAAGLPVGRFRIDGGDVSLALETLRLTPFDPTDEAALAPAADPPAEPAIPVPSP